MNAQGTAKDAILYLYLLTLCPSPGFLPNEAHYLIQFSTLGAIVAHCAFTNHRTSPIPVVGYTSLCCVFFLALGVNATAIDIPHGTFLRETLKLLTFPILFLLAPVTSEAGTEKVRRALYILTAIQASLILVTSTKLGAELTNLLYDTQKLSPGRSLSEKVRYLGTFENPNYLAFFLCMSYAYLATQSKATTKATLLLVYLVLVILTGSRTGLIALLAAASAIHYKICFSIALPLFVFINIDALFSSLPLRFQEITSVAKAIESHSLSIRLEILRASGDLIKERPFIGYFESPIDITDNWYVLVALRYGFLVCLIAAAVLAFSLVSRFGRSFINSRTVIFTLVPLIFSLTGAFLDNPRLYGLATILLISTIRAPRRSRNTI